jgi:hypothetical protein
LYPLSVNQVSSPPLCFADRIRMSYSPTVYLASMVTPRDLARVISSRAIPLACGAAIFIARSSMA